MEFFSSECRNLSVSSALKIFFNACFGLIVAVFVIGRCERVAYDVGRMGVEAPDGATVISGPQGEPA